MIRCGFMLLIIHAVISFFFFGGFLIICDPPEDFDARGDRTCNTLTQHVKPREAREARGAREEIKIVLFVCIFFTEK